MIHVQLMQKQFLVEIMVRHKCNAHLCLAEAIKDTYNYLLLIEWNFYR